jgi:hypothetical protein
VIKIWNSKGELIQNHNSISRSELTCCSTDNRELKLFVGNCDGKIYTINIKNGAKMKKF